MLRSVSEHGDKQVSRGTPHPSTCLGRHLGTHIWRTHCDGVAIVATLQEAVDVLVGCHGCWSIACARIILGSSISAKVGRLAALEICTNSNHGNVRSVCSGRLTLIIIIIIDYTQQQDLRRGGLSETSPIIKVQELIQLRKVQGIRSFSYLPVTRSQVGIMSWQCPVPVARTGSFRVENLRIPQTARKGRITS